MDRVRSLPRRRARGANVHGTIGSFRVSLRSDLPEVLRDFSTLYPAGSGAGDDQGGVIGLEVRRAGRSRSGRRLYRVYADGGEVGGRRHARGVFPLLEWGINLRIMATRTEYLQLHAASMSYRGQGVILAGASGRGKSTLAAILMSRGWKYLCDEFAMVDPATMELEPFPKALCIKQGSYPVVRGLGLPFTRRRDYLKELKGRVGYINARDAVAGGVGARVPARFIVFPVYEPGRPVRVERVCRSHAAMRLFRGCFNRGAFPEAGLGALTTLVRECRCFKLESGDPDATAELLEASLDQDALTRDTHDPLPTGRTEARADAALHSSTPTGRPRLRSRREMLRAGAKVAYVAPAVLSLSAGQAFAAGSNPSGICSTAADTGEACDEDSDCCSNSCTLLTCD